VRRCHGCGHRRVPVGCVRQSPGIRSDASPARRSEDTHTIALCNKYGVIEESEPARRPRSRNFRGIAGALILRLRRRRGPSPCRVSAPRRRAQRVVPRDRRTSGDVPGRGGAACRRPPVAEVRGAGVPGFPHVRRAGARLCAAPLWRLRLRAAGPVLVQGARVLPELRRPAHDRGRRASRGRHPAACAGAPVGAEPAPPAPLSHRVGPQALSRRALRAGTAVVPAKTRAAPRPSRRPLGLRDGHSAVRGRAQPERPLPHAGPRRRIGPCRRRRTRRSAPSSQRSTCGCAASCAVRASTRLPPISHARIRSRSNHRCSRALAALRSRAGSRSGPARGGVCGRWGKSRTRHGCCRATRGTRTSRASISTRMSPYRLPTAGAWSNSVAICCARPSRKSGCGGWATTASCSR